MISTHSLSAIDALIRCVAMGEHCREMPAASVPLVCTVSSGAGSGGREVAKRLAERLEVGLFDHRILQEVAHETRIDPEVLRRLDERVEGMKGAWLRSLLTGEDVFKETVRRNLINVILGIACRGGVILGRGGNFILAHRPVLRVRIVGSPSRCARRIAERRGVELSAAELARQRTDLERKEFIRQFYGRDIDDPLGYDLVLNSDRLAPEAVTEIAFLALRRLRKKVLEPTGQ